MNNRVLFGIMMIIFNSYGVPSFMQGQVKTGILRIVLAFVTCGILVLLVVYLFTNKTRVLTVTKVLVCIGFILSLCPLLYGIRFFSVVGALISVSLIAEWVLLLAAANPRYNESLQ